MAPPELAARLESHSDPQAWIDVGNWFGEHNQLACAQQAFRSGLRLDPASPQLNYLLALSLYESGDPDDALAPLQRSLEADNSVLKPHLLLATLYARLGQAADAEKEWRAALQIDAGSGMALHGVSQALLAQKNYPAEIALLHSAKLDPSLAIDLAVACNAVGRVDEALSTIKNALSLDPDSVQLSVALVTLDVRNNLSDQAEQQAGKCYLAHPDDVEAQVSYMKTLVLNGNWTAAAPVGQKLLSDAPHRYETLYLNGLLERQSGDFAAARDHLTEAESLNPNVASLHYNLGVALARLHDLGGAIDELRKAIAQGDTQPETHFELANALRLEGKTEEAREEMLLSQKRAQEEAQISVATAKTAEADQAMEKDDSRQAIALYREAIDATPNNTLILWKLSLALDKANDFGGEHKVLEQVIRIDPGFALAHNQLGYLDSRSSDFVAAEEHFRHAVQAAPEFTQAWVSLAATLGMESKFPEAEEALGTALRLDPENSQAHELDNELARARNRPHGGEHSPGRPHRR